MFLIGPVMYVWKSWKWCGQRSGGAVTGVDEVTAPTFHHQHQHLIMAPVEGPEAVPASMTKLSSSRCH